MAAPPLPLPYELRIGVTGHRTLSNATAVDAAVLGALARIAGVFRNRDNGKNRDKVDVPLAWTVVSPLAKGADRIVAHAVLNFTGARLEVITPLPLDEYRKDFDTREDLAEFESLVSRADSVHELNAGSDAGDLSGEARDRAYLQAGERVVDGCEILIAVWDGQPAKRKGGTGEVVGYAQRRGRLVVWIDSNHPEIEPALPDVVKGLSFGYHQQASFLSDRAIDVDVLDEAVQQEAEALQKVAATAALPAGALDLVLASLLPVYVRADRLAVHYQQSYVRAANAIPYLAAFAVTVAAAQILFLPGLYRLAIVEVVSMLAVFGVWRLSRREQWHEKWLHDRFLAEQLRGAMFLTLFGHEGERALTDPLPFYPGPHQWLESVVRNLQQDTAAHAKPLPLKPLQTFLGTAWLTDQQSFHGRNTVKKTRRAHKRHRLGGALFGATLLMAFLHFVGVGHASHAEVMPVLNAGTWIVFFALTLPAWAAAVHAITTQLELERIAARSSQMAQLLEALAHRADHARSEDELRDVSLEAAKLMATESREWWALLSFQELKLHA